MWLNSLVSGKQRSADALCKKGHYWLFIYIACVCVVETFSTGKWHNALNKYIHKYAKHFTVDGEKKKIRWQRVFREEKKIYPLMDVWGYQPKYTLKRRWWPAETNTWLTELPQCNDENEWQFFFLKDCFKKKNTSIVPVRNLEAFVFTWCELKGESFSSESWGPLRGDQSGAMHAKLSYYSTYVDIQYNHIYMCFLDCDKVVFYSLLYRWCKL